MKKKYIIVITVLIFIINMSASAQQTFFAGPSDTLVVMWTSGDQEVALEACLMYAHAAKKNKWFNEVILIVWGPSQKLVIENTQIREKVSAMQKDGVIIQACIACSNMLGVTDQLKSCNIDVKGMGVPLTRYLKRGYKVLTY